MTFRDGTPDADDGMPQVGTFNRIADPKWIGWQGKKDYGEHLLHWLLAPNRAGPPARYGREQRREHEFLRVQR